MMKGIHKNISIEIPEISNPAPTTEDATEGEDDSGHDVGRHPDEVETLILTTPPAEVPDIGLAESSEIGHHVVVEDEVKDLLLEIKSNTLDAETADEAATTEDDEVEDTSLCACVGHQCVCTSRLKVYVSHFLSSWGDRMWAFAGGLFLMEVTPGSLRLAAVYGAAMAVVVIIAGAPVGKWVDRSQRLRAAQISLVIQNTMVCVCAALLVWLTTRRDFIRTYWDGWALLLLEAGVVTAACIAGLGSLGSKLVIEKDWIVVVCGRNKARLATMNSVLRSIDLSTQIMAPLMVGAIMTSSGLIAGGMFIAGWNIVSFVLEYGLLHRLYYSTPLLRLPKEITQEMCDDDKRSFYQKFIHAWSAWLFYVKHPVRDAGLALAMLYMTVLALDNYSRAFVYELGVSESILGALTAVAALVGLTGSAVFPLLRQKLGTTATGLVGFLLEPTCLIMAVASVFAPGSPFEPSAIFVGSNQPVFENVSSATAAVFSLTESGELNHRVYRDFTSVSLLLAGILSSRFGLWISDLSVSQIIQEEVADGERGSINGVQFSLNMSLDLIRSILLIILPTSQTFGYLVLLSFAFKVSGLLFFLVYVRHRRIRKSNLE